MKDLLKKVRRRLTVTKQRWAARLGAASVAPGAPAAAASPPQPERVFYKAHSCWLVDRTWLEPYKELLETDRLVDAPPTRILDRRFTLIQFARSVRCLPGSTVECGVYRGVGSALICKTLEGTYRNGARHYGFDSFDGLPDLTTKDQPKTGASVWKRGSLRSVEETVREYLRPFPFCHLEKGWIPERFGLVQDESFRLVHIDVDLHDPTRDCLEFFYPRTVKGGVLLFDDYGSAYCPGARAAIERFFQDRPEHVIELVSGQAFAIKQ